MNKNTHRFTELHSYSDYNIFGVTRLTYKNGLIERPSNWESVRDTVLRAKEQQKYDTKKSFSAEICRAYAASMKGEEDLKNNFSLLKFLQFAQNHRANLGVAPPEQLTDNERKIREKVYKRDGDKWISRTKEDKKKVREINTQIQQKVKTLTGLMGKSSRTNADLQRVRKLNAEIQALKTKRNRVEAKIEKIESYEKTVRWMVYRHVALRVSKQNQFRIQRAAEKEKVGQKGVEQKFGDKLAEMRETLGEMSGGRLLALAGFGMWALYMTKYMSPKLKEAFKFSAVSSIGFMLVNYGAVPLLAKNKTGLEVFANVIEDMRRTGGPLYLALRRNKKEKLSEFAKRAKPMSKALLLMQQNETPAKDVIEAYYEARRKASGKNKENGNITKVFPGISINGKELYAGLHIIFSKYKAKDPKTGKWLVALNSKSFKKKTFADWVSEKLGDDGSFSMEKSWAMRTLRGGKKLVNEIGKKLAKAMENAPYYLKKAYFQVINNKQIRKAFEEGKLSIGKVLSALLSGATTIAQIPGAVAKKIDDAIASFKGGDIGLFMDKVFEKLYMLNTVTKKQNAAFILGAQTAKYFKKPDDIADYVWKKYHKKASPTVGYAFRAVATYLDKAQLNALEKVESSEAYYVGVKVNATSNKVADRIKAMKLAHTIAVNKIFDDKNKEYTTLKYQRETIRKKLQVAYAAVTGTNEIRVFFRIRKPSSLVTKANENRHIFNPKDHQDMYEHLPISSFFDHVLAKKYTRLLSYPTNVGNTKMLQRVYGNALGKKITKKAVIEILKAVYLKYGDPKKLNAELVKRGLYKKPRDMHKKNQEGMLNYFISLARKLATDSKFIESIRGKI